MNVPIRQDSEKGGATRRCYPFPAQRRGKGWVPLRLH